jgi:TolA-binding protein
MNGLDKQVAAAVSKYKPERRLGGGPEWNAKLLDRVEAAIASRDFESARLQLRRIDTKSLGEPTDAMHARFASAMSQISVAAQNDYQLAMTDVEAGRYNVAIETLRRLAKDFADMPVGQQASQTLTKLENDPKVAQARRSNVNEKLAANALKRARRAMADGDDQMAYRRLQAIIDRYAGTEAAGEATDLIATYTNDADFMAKLDSGDGG